MKELTLNEERQFTCYFEDYVVMSFSDKLSHYIGDFRIIGSRPDAGGATVYSQIQAMRVDWYLTPSAGSYRIRDVTIDGVSLAAGGRSDLEGVVQRNGGQATAILPVMRQETVKGVPDRCLF